MKIFRYLSFILLTALLSAGIKAQPKATEAEEVKVESYKRIDNPARREVSGIIKSVLFEDTFWVHGDSGTEDRIYAINSRGELKSLDKDFKGTRLIGAKNKDWEDISRGPDSTLIITDLGNNCHCRDDMKVFVIKEPGPGDSEVTVLNEYEIEYEKSEGLARLIFDTIPNSEATFVKQGVIYVISKEPGNARLFRLDDPSEERVNEFKKADQFPFRELVTGADISPDEKKLAVLTYKSIWIFDLINEKELFQNPVTKIPLKGTEQVESVTFDGNSVIIAEENGNLYRIGLPI